LAIFSDFDIANDLKVEMLLPQGVGNTFVLGISLLGGSDVLGDDSSGTLAWQDLACEINRVQTSLGGSVASNVFYQADAGKATINLQSWEFDPTNYAYIRPSTRVRVRISRGAYSFVIWSGAVDNIEVTYAPDQPNQITIQATDIWALLVNRRFDYEPDFFVPDSLILPNQAIDAACYLVTVSGFPIESNPGATINPQPAMTTTAQLNTTFGNVVSNILNTGLGFTWVNPNNGELEYRSRTTSGLPIYTVGNNHGDPGHLCMADLSVNTRSDDIYNNVLITSKYEHLGNPVFTVLYKDQDSIDLYGERSDDFTVDVARVMDAETWSDLVFAPKPVTTVQNVVSPAIDRSRSLTEIVEFMPSDLVGVYYVTDEMNIDTTYTVTKVSHSIDVNNWFTTLETWKEF
jgi:hypothetical protein